MESPSETILILDNLNTNIILKCLSISYIKYLKVYRICSKYKKKYVFSSRENRRNLRQNRTHTFRQCFKKMYLGLL